MTTNSSFQGDGVLIITALREELEAILALTPVDRKIEHLSKAIRVAYRLRCPVPCVALCATTMGQTSAALLASSAVSIFHPRTVILGGIAGGISDDMELGDVIISEQIVDYELGKVSGGGIIPRWSVYRGDPGLLHICRNLEDRAWLSRVQAEPSQKVSRSARAHIGVILSGNKVIADADTAGALKFFWTQALGIEMEAAGVAAALESSDDEVSFLMIKGVSDRANPSKDDRWRGYAAATSAAYVAEVLSRIGAVSPINVESRAERVVLAHGVDRRSLRFALGTAFDMGELAALAFDLGVDWEDIPGRTKTEKIIGLITFFERRRRTAELVEKVAEERSPVLESFRGYRP